MEQTRKVQFVAPATPPTIEHDPSVMAWYIRFSSAKIAKTISEDAPGYMYAIDLDARGRVVGFELLGVRVFSFEKLLKIPRIDFSKTDFKRAKFVSVADRSLVEA